MSGAGDSRGGSGGPGPAGIGERAVKLALVLFFAALWFHLTGPLTDPDFWWHLASGRWMWEHTSLLGHDPFAIDIGAQEPPLNRLFILKQYWLAQLLFYAVYAVAGLKGVIVLCASVHTAMFALLYRLMRLSGVDRLASVLLVAAAAASVVDEFGYVGARPQMWSSLFAVLVVYLLELLRLRRRWAAAALPGLMLLWSNLHGGYILGDIIIVVTALGWLLFRTGSRTSYAAAAAALVCSGLNPSGFTAFVSAPFVGPILTALNVTSQQQLKSVTDSIVESQSIFGHARWTGIVRMLPVFSGLVALSLASFAVNLARRERLRKDLLLLYLLVLLMGLRSIRFIIFFVTLSSFITAVNIRAFLGGRAWPQRVFAKGGLVWVTLVATLALAATAASAGWRFSALAAPVPYDADYDQAVAFIRGNGLRGNLFNDYTAGGYLIWRLAPENRVFIDGRGLSPKAYEMSRATLDHPEARTPGINLPYYMLALSNFDVNLVLIPGCDRVSGVVIKLAPVLAEDPGWALVFADENALLFMRKLPQNREFVQRHALPKALAYRNILGLATRAYRDGHARVMSGWKLSLAVGYAGVGDAAEARRWVDDYLQRAPADEYAQALRRRLEIPPK